jgi:hypothetical protein
MTSGCGALMTNSRHRPAFEDNSTSEQATLLSFAASDAHQMKMTWCCIQKLCINSGDRPYAGVPRLDPLPSP